MKNYITLIVTLCICVVQSNAQTMIFTQDITASRAFDGVFGSATLQIDDAGNDGMITKPLIVAEGFESGLLGAEDPFGENNIRSFSRSVNLGQSNNLEFFLTGGTVNTTGDQDYDIIFVNWDDGRDDLRRNAYVLQEVINWVNQEKADAGSTEQNVVLGQSMGGVIARYALADMEARNLDHDTSLYISHDAPHQGANLPISIQYLARHLSDQFVSTPVGDFDLPAAGGGSVTIRDIQNAFNSTGTRQLLANNINGSFQLDNDAYEAWQTELQLKGYPQLTRNIAISNGSHCANMQELGPQQELLFLSGDIEPTILLDLIINYVPFLAPLENLGYIALAIILEDPAYLAGLLPGRTNFNARFEAKTLPNAGQIANIYKGRIRITKKINFLLFTLSYNINITDRNYNNPNEVQLPLDSYSGGALLVPFNLSEINNATNNWLVNLNVTGRSANNFNFIPTASALDVGNGNTTLTEPDYLRTYNAANPPLGSLPIPFNNYTTSFNNNGTNEIHISFNTRNGDWLATELNDINGDEFEFDCTFTCSDVDLFIEDNIICSSTSFILGSDNIFGNINVSQGQNLVNIFGAGTNTLTIVPISLNVKGLLSFSFSIGNNDCGAQTFEKAIWIGKPLDDLSMISSGGFTLSTGNWYQLTAMHQNFDYFIHGDLTYQWQIPYAQIMFSNNNRVASVLPTQLGTYPYKLKTENICGCSDWITRHFEVLSTPGKGDLYISPTGN